MSLDEIIKHKEEVAEKLDSVLEAYFNEGLFKNIKKKFL